MIEKKRLEELIEQGATIYELFENKNINQIKLENNWTVLNGGLYKDINYIRSFWIGDLFETIEEAEWHKEFGCIERTERLELPTWEEIENDFIIHKQSGGNYCVKEFFGKEQEYSLGIVVWNGEAKVAVGDDDFYEPLTKENYTLACRQCVKLFKGE